MLCRWMVGPELKKSCLGSKPTSISSYGTFITVLSPSEAHFICQVGIIVVLTSHGYCEAERVNLMGIMPSIC